MARRRSDALTFVGAVVLALAPAAPAGAHAFGQRYDLPIPLWLYLAGAGAAVALSFAVMALFVRESHRHARYPRLNLLGVPVVRLAAHPYTLTAVRIASVALFILILAAGFLGNQNPLKNLAPTMVWVIWWVGMAYVSVLLGDLWAVINPLKIIFSWAEALYGRLGKGAALTLGLAYPPWLGAWPSVVFLLVFDRIELVSEAADVPAALASLIAGYALITWWGMFVFGKAVWLRHGEVFSVVFSLLARFAPTEGEESDAGAQSPPRWNLRPYAVGLLTDGPIHSSRMVLVLLMLSTVTFDGFIETPAWAGILDWLMEDRTVRPMLLEVRAAGFNLLAFVQTMALIVFPILFLGVYGLFGRLIAGAGGGGLSVGEVCCTFVLSLIPIAIAYHLAHYLSFLLLAGQMVIPLASDPFGFGWNLLGTASYRIDISIVNARMVWYLAVTAIVAGHVVAVYLAHVTALRVFKETRIALRSQYPMLVLMVGYTMISLWILAQPVVSGGG